MLRLDTPVSLTLQTRLDCLCPYWAYSSHPSGAFEMCWSSLFGHVNHRENRTGLTLIFRRVNTFGCSSNVACTHDYLHNIYTHTHTHLYTHAYTTHFFASCSFRSICIHIIANSFWVKTVLAINCILAHTYRIIHINL